MVMTENAPEGPPGGEGVLTVAINSQGKDDYDFRPRAALIRQTKEDMGLGEFEALPSPWTVEIEPTLNCNAFCHFCSYEEDIARFKLAVRQSKGQEYGLTRNTVFGLLDALEEGGTTEGTYWSGGGEPLVWPYIVDGVKRASEFSQVFMQTNGIGLGKFMRKPEDLASIRLLSVSVYADNPDLHKEIAGVNSFQKVVDNVRRARELRDQHEMGLTLNAKVMVDTKNYRRAPQIVRFYRDLGVDTVGLREVQDYNYGGEGQRQTSVELTDAQRQELCDVIVSSEYQDSSLQSFALSVSRKAAKPMVTQHCYNALDGHFACVDAWGKVYVGNPEIGEEKFCIGNINEQPWEDIWKGERHQEVVTLMDTMQREGACASELCRHVRANIGAQEYVTGQMGRQERASVIRALGAFM